MEALQGLSPLPVPHLPTAAVGLCVCGDERAAAALRARGIATLPVAPSPAQDAEIAAHADCLLCHIGGRELVLSPDQPALAAALAARGFRVIFSGRLGRVYPKDCALDAAVCGEFAVCNPKTADPRLLAALEKKKTPLLPVRQGYTKCALCIAAPGAAITADRPIADRLRARGWRVLLISPGGVLLSRRHAGLIGGACGLIAPDTLAVCGDLSLHPDGGAIAAFLAAAGVTPLSLFGGPPTDVGGILPLMQKEAKERSDV